MAPTNLDLVRSIYAGWERGDFGSADWAHAEIEVVFPDGLETHEEQGLNEMADAWRRWLAAWDHLRIEADEVRELDGNRVLVLGRWTGRGKTSGLDITEITTNPASLFHVSDGKVIRLVLYVDDSQALDDLGLAREPGTPAP